MLQICFCKEALNHNCAKISSLSDFLRSVRVSMEYRDMIMLNIATVFQLCVSMLKIKYLSSLRSREEERTGNITKRGHKNKLIVVQNRQSADSTFVKINTYSKNGKIVYKNTGNKSHDAHQIKDKISDHAQKSSKSP